MSANKKLTCGFAIILAVAAATIWSVDAQSRTFKRPPRVEVVMIRCAVDDSFSVDGFGGSPSTPSRRVGGCPYNLSELQRDGFEIADVRHFDHGEDFIVYTLTR